MDLKTLYRDIILDHYRRPRNAEPLQQANCEARCKNPACGDRVTLQLRLEGGKVAELGLLGNGCAISQASASMMTEAVKGRTVEESETIMAEFRRMIVDGVEQPDPKILGDLLTLQGIAKLHARVKCAMCGWSALEAALHDGGGAEIDLTDDKSMPESAASPGNV